MDGSGLGWDGEGRGGGMQVYISVLSVDGYSMYSGMVPYVPDI